MAKDGTLRGANATGRPKKSALEKAESGNPGRRKIEILNIEDGLDAPDMEGVDMPPVDEYLNAKQKDGKELPAADIYKKTYQWLKKLGVEKLVNKQLVNQYAMSVSRWIQCEEAISNFGFLAKHPTTGAAMTSPYVSMSQSYLKQVNLTWMQIFQIVKENCSIDFKGPNPQDDMMERLLQARSKGKLPT